MSMFPYKPRHPIPTEEILERLYTCAAYISREGFELVTIAVTKEVFDEIKARPHTVFDPTERSFILHCAYGPFKVVY